MAKQPIPVAGRVVAITGAARGIGRATAQALVQAGAKVAIGDLDIGLAQQTAKEIGGSTVAFPVDVTDRGSFADFLESAENALGPLDVLVNNAGIMPIGPFLEESDEIAIRQFDINVHGVIHGMKLALPGMLARGRGHIVNISSTAGTAGFAGGATYCGTKAAVINISEAVRAEVRGSNVEISVVMPGVVNTELATGLNEARAVKKVQPEDVAAAIVETLAQPKFDVFVPKSIASIRKAMLLLPRSAREGISRALKADQVLGGADMGARKAYELRAATSTKELSPAAQQPALPSGEPGPEE